MRFQELSSSETWAVDQAYIGMTKHALARMQQRGVDRDLLQCLLAYGHHEPDHKGCNVVTFDGKAMDDLARYEPKEFKAKATGTRKLYAVVDSEGVVITAGHRIRRVPRDLSLSSLRPGRSRRPEAINATWNPYRQ